ncbi:MAG: carbohydrate ABC transporter permease [Anaerolineae bacterium]|nr:carbohydrate ABC transporter permease [Anaerolineae bacterium]
MIHSSSPTPSWQIWTRPGWWRKLSISQVIVEILKYFILITLAVSFLLPFFWMATSALKDDSQVYTFPPVWIPRPAHWNNFPDAWNFLPFNLYLFNTVVKYAVPSTIGTVLSSALVAYGFARIRWPGRDILFSICLMTMMVPGQVTLIPLFITFKKMGWVNTYLPLVVPAYFGNAYFIFMLRQFFRTIPLELSDAARIDGASEFAILFHVILPLVRPALAVVALFQFMWTWNDYFGPLIYVNIRPQWTLALGLEHLRNQATQVGTKVLAYPYLMAVSTIITLPIVLLFFFAQRTFIEGITLTGMKG